MREAIIYFKKTKFVYFEIECYFKILYFLKRFSSKTFFNETVRYTLDSMPTVSKEENFKIYLKIASIYYELEMFRKFGFFLRQLAVMFAAENLEMSKDLYFLASPFYNIFQLKSQNRKFHTERTWPKLQLDFLNEFLNTSSHDYHTKNLILLEIMQTFVKDCNPSQQHINMKNLNMNSAYANFVSSADFHAFPQLIQILPVLPKENYKRNLLGEKVKDLFIFEPWKKNKSVLKYPVDETIQIKVVISNPLDIDMFIDLLYFSVEGVEIISFPSKNFEIIR